MLSALKILFILADYNDPASLESALEGVDVLVNLLGCK
jgi:uncharacterized protein YbjT (DUF2867 family)